MLLGTVRFQKGPSSRTDGYVVFGMRLRGPFCRFCGTLSFRRSRLSLSVWRPLINDTLTIRETSLKSITRAYQHASVYPSAELALRGCRGNLCCWRGSVTCSLLDKRKRFEERRCSTLEIRTMRDRLSSVLQATSEGGGQEESGGAGRGAAGVAGGSVHFLEQPRCTCCVGRQRRRHR